MQTTESQSLHMGHRVSVRSGNPYWIGDRYKPEDSGWMLSTLHTVRTFLNYLSDSLEGSNVSWIEYRLLVEMADQLDILGEGSMCDYRCLADVVKDIPAWYWDR